MKKIFKSGIVSIIGKPNVGKSTLMNYFLGQKLSIVSNKPETTRDNILGVMTSDDFQILFLDTPGIHQPRVLLGKYMVASAKGALLNTDVIVFVVDARSGLKKDDYLIADLLKDLHSKVVFVINKVDTMRKEKVLPLIEQLSTICHTDEVIPLSALDGDNMDVLLETICTYLPEGEKYYDEDHLTDKSERFFVSELVREKILQKTFKEVPHSCFVAVEEFKEREKGKMYISAVVYVEKLSQKGIIIGKHGTMLKEVGFEARKSIEKFLGREVFLDIWVKVEKDWKKSEKALRKLGYTRDTK